MAKIVSQYKVCSRCKKHLHVDSYRKIKKRGRVEIYSRCIDCERLTGREWGAKNKDIVSKKNKRYYENNREKEIERSKKYHRDHPEYGRSQSRKFRENNPEKKKFWDKRYYENNKEKFILNEHKRRARVKEVGGTITRKEWSALKKKYGNRCINPKCKDPYAKPLTLDHVTPIFLGGKNIIENAQPLCKSCNSRKNIKTTDYRKYYD